MSEWIWTVFQTPLNGEVVAIYPHIHCHQFASWNELEQCWDHEDGDDYMSDKEDVVGWCQIPPVPENMMDRRVPGPIVWKVMCVGHGCPDTVTVYVEADTKSDVETILEQKRPYCSILNIIPAFPGQYKAIDIIK